MVLILTDSMAVFTVVPSAVSEVVKANLFSVVPAPPEFMAGLKTVVLVGK